MTQLVTREASPGPHKEAWVLSGTHCGQARGAVVVAAGIADIGMGVADTKVVEAAGILEDSDTRGGGMVVDVLARAMALAANLTCCLSDPPGEVSV